MRKRNTVGIGITGADGAKQEMDGVAGLDLEVGKLLQARTEKHRLVKTPWRA